jgi:hypothetical protein
MTAAALKAIFESVGWGGFREDEYPQQIARAREILVTGSRWPGDIEGARRLVAAVDKAEGDDADERATKSPEQRREAQRERDAEKETERLERQRRGSAAAGESADEELILGLLADGTKLPAGGCEASGKDPIEYLGTAATLTSSGRRILGALQEVAASDPATRARQLGIDVEAVTAAARANGLPPAAAVRAEVEFIELINRERAADGLPPAQSRTAIPVPSTVIGADGDPAKAEADFQALLAREKAASGCKTTV